MGRRLTLMNADSLVLSAYDLRKSGGAMGVDGQLHVNVVTQVELGSQEYELVKV